MADVLPLSAQLSAAYVAFVVETDNAAEQQVAHKTTSFDSPGGSGAVWLASLVMWFNCVGPLADAGRSLSVAELTARTRMTTNLDGMRRWGYLTIDGVGRIPRRSGGAGRPHATPRSVLALTQRGHAADAVWRPLPAVIEQHWRDRFGVGNVDRLRAALLAIAASDTAAFPDLMPIVPPRLGRVAVPALRDPERTAGDSHLAVVSLLARVLLRFTADCDRDARIPISVWSNLLRVLDPVESVAVRELPVLTGVSKEILAVLIRALLKAAVITAEPAAARGQQLRLNDDRGVRARAAGSARIASTVAGWESTYGRHAVGELSAALTSIVGDATRQGSPLFAGLDPEPNAWRARVTPPQLLPWYPLVTHRGGYPDGS